MIKKWHAFEISNNQDHSVWITLHLSIVLKAWCLKSALRMSKAPSMLTLPTGFWQSPCGSVRCNPDSTLSAALFGHRDADRDAVFHGLDMADDADLPALGLQTGMRPVDG
jgi:hypothetical protein